jgi:hypothetical protein
MGFHALKLTKFRLQPLIDKPFGDIDWTDAH